VVINETRIDFSSFLLCRGGFAPLTMADRHEDIDRGGLY